MGEREHAVAFGWAIAIRRGMEPDGEWFVLTQVHGTRSQAIDKYSESVGRKFYDRQRKRGCARATWVEIRTFGLPAANGAAHD